MGDYTPVFKPGQALTFTAGADIVGRQHVEVTGDFTVSPAAAGSSTCVGQAGHDAPSGSRVTVHTPGRPVHEALAGSAVAAGDHVKVGATADRIVPFTEGTDPESARLGIALEGAAADATCRYQTV